MEMRVRVLEEEMASKDSQIEVYEGRDKENVLVRA